MGTSYKKKYKKLFVTIVSLCMILCLLYKGSDKVEAVMNDYYSSWEILTNAANQVITGKYRVPTSKTISSSGVGKSGITISGTVDLYIPTGVTLTVTGGNGDGTTGGGAGIELPEGSTLRIYGGGTVKATGGKAGMSTKGIDCDISTISGLGPEKVGVGGNGGGGAGAGIGGKGGSGGTGGLSARNYDTTTGKWTIKFGGEMGTAGTQGTKMGTLYVFDSVKLSCTGGSANFPSTAYVCSLLNASGLTHTTWGAQSPGGHGGSAANIGGGAGGGGGGSSFGLYFGAGAGGGNNKSNVVNGGKLNSTFGTGSSDSRYNSADGLSSNSIKGGATQVFTRDGKPWAGGDFYNGIAGADGGVGGTGGTVYYANTVVNATGGNINECCGAAATVSRMTTTTLDRQDGTTSNIYLTNGLPLTALSSIPTRTGYKFLGYNSKADGTGTKYIDENGNPTTNAWSSSVTKIYVVWESQKVKLTLNLTDCNVTVTGATKNGSYYEMIVGNTVTLTATPNTGKTFVSFSCDDYPAFSTGDSSYSFTAPDYALTIDAIALTGNTVEDSIEVNLDDFPRTYLYYNINVNVKLDNTLSNVGQVTIRDDSNKIISSLKEGTSPGSYTYTYTQADDSAVYKVYVGEEDTGQTIDYSLGGNKKFNVDYYTLRVNTTLDGVKKDFGSINLISDTETITVPYDNTSGHNYYEHKRLKSNSNYKVFINNEDIGKNVVFNSAQNINVPYRSANIKVRQDGVAIDKGKVSLRKNGINKYTLNGENGIYNAMTLSDTDSYDIYINEDKVASGLAFNGSTKTVDYYTVSYNVNGATGNVPEDQLYLADTKINVASDGDLTKANSYFGGWQSGGKTYDSGDDYTVNGKTEFVASWENNTDAQAVWSSDGTTWIAGTLAEAVDMTNKTSGALQVKIQKSGVMNDLSTVNISPNKSWSIESGVVLTLNAMNPLTSSPIIKNSGTLTNKGTISGTGTILNTGTIDNTGSKITVSTINNEVVIPGITEDLNVKTSGVLIGGTYGVVGSSSPKTYVNGGEITGSDGETIVIGDYSTLNNVSVKNKNIKFSVMGGANISSTGPTEAQLKESFGGMATHNKEGNLIVLKGNLSFRTDNVYNGVAVDPGGNTPNLNMKKVSADVYKELNSGDYELNNENTVKILSDNMYKGPASNPLIYVASGTKTTWMAYPDKSNGYEFIGWYSTKNEDADGKITFTDRVSKDLQYTVNSVSSDNHYYAVFKQKNYEFVVNNDSNILESTVEVKDQTTNLAQAETKKIDIDYGASAVVTPKEVSENYRFLGYLKTYDDGTTENIIEYEDAYFNDDEVENPEAYKLPKEQPYQTNSAKGPIDYNLTVMARKDGMLHFNLAGGVMDASVDLSDLDLTAGDVTIPMGTPTKTSDGSTYKFKYWQDGETLTSYKPGDIITPTADQGKYGMTLIAVYGLVGDDPFKVTKTGTTYTYSSLNSAVKDTIDVSSPVYGVKTIVYDDGTSNPTGTISGTLPNGYTLKTKDASTMAQLSVDLEKTLEIGDKTTSNSDNSVNALSLGARVENIDLISNDGMIKLDGQHSSLVKGKVILYPNNYLQLVSDLNTSNIVNIQLLDSQGVESDIKNSKMWKKDSIVVVADPTDGDDSVTDGVNDNEYNLMTGRVKLMNTSYSVYNDHSESTISGGESLRLFASSDVVAMRKPLQNDSNYVVEYRTLQDALDDSSKENMSGTNQADSNSIYVLADNDEDLVITGDDNSDGKGRFADNGDDTYNHEVSLIQATRGANRTVSEDNTKSFTLSGEISLKGVSIDSQNYGTVWNLYNLKLPTDKNLNIQPGSYLNLTTSHKVWSTGQTIIKPLIEKASDVKDKTVVVKSTSDISSHFVLDEESKTNGCNLKYNTTEKVLEIKVMSGVEFSTQPTDTRKMVGDGFEFTAKVKYPTDVNDGTATDDIAFQQFDYKWQKKSSSAAEWVDISKDDSSIVYNNGVATITYKTDTSIITETGTMYRCLAWNVRDKLEDKIPESSVAQLTIENSVTSFVSIPKNIELRREDEKTVSNKESNTLDKRNMISLNVSGNETISDGKFVVTTSEDLVIRREGDYLRSYIVYVYKPDNATQITPTDNVLMELSSKGKKEERFYLKTTYLKNQVEGIYRGTMTFNIEYKKASTP